MRDPLNAVKIFNAKLLINYLVLGISMSQEKIELRTLR